MATQRCSQCALQTLCTNKQSPARETATSGQVRQQSLRKSPLNHAHSNARPTL
ncbi:hypothetical protein [Spirosoma profusum]|uniref:hypothetical protein n=1 Tax=Spirosoma profusum TaxID=2771354 RepID=UPI0016840F8B|nr:hypothetical protein [Spirosoma profusum]